LIVPNAMDSPAKITQEPIQPGGSDNYEFTVKLHGTYFYGRETLSRSTACWVVSSAWTGSFGSMTT
jgi:hypothetical protein